MKFDRPEFYFEASLERIKQAKVLYDEGASFALSMYAAGVAVESLLRAFKMLRDSTFDEKHNLLKMFKASGILDFDPELLKRKKLSTEDIQTRFRHVQVAVADVHKLWSIDFRFASEARLHTDLKKRQLDRGIRGDPLKENARRLLVSSHELIDKGVVQWNLLKKSGRS